MKQGYFTEQGTPTQKALEELNFFKLYEGLPINTIMNMNPFVEYQGRKMLCLEYAYSVPDEMIKQDMETLGVTPYEIQETGFPYMISTIIYRYLFDITAIESNDTNIPEDVLIELEKAKEEYIDVEFTEV